MFELFVLGLFLGLVVDVVWFKWPQHRYFYPLYCKSRLHFVEHYHWALFLLILEVFFGNGFFAGFASALLISERFHFRPFKIVNKWSLMLLWFELVVLTVCLTVKYGLLFSAS